MFGSSHGFICLCVYFVPQDIEISSDDELDAYIEDLVTKGEWNPASPLYYPHSHSLHLCFMHTKSFSGRLEMIAGRPHLHPYILWQNSVMQQELHCQLQRNFRFKTPLRPSAQPWSRLNLWAAGDERFKWFRRPCNLTTLFGFTLHSGFEFMLAVF